MISYSIEYSPATIAGEPGYQYTIRDRGREVRSGWSRGRKRLAEEQARQDLFELEHPHRRT
jgi:hypothetical protein